MYLAECDRADVAARGLRAIPGTVFALGAVSLITDVSSEMVTAVLPCTSWPGSGSARSASACSTASTTA